MHDKIIIRGAAEHNLKNISVEIPHQNLTVVTGLSGSGKSSLAFDIVYREGQRRFVESLSAYARQYLGKLDKPRVEHIEGLSPTISIDQKTISRNPRSTVGTITEILDHLRLLFARLGDPHCPHCGDPIQSRTVDQIVESAYQEWPGQDLVIAAPIILDRKGEYRKELEELREQGFVRVRIDGTIRRLDEDIQLARYENHTIEVVYDRVRLEPERRSRVSESVEKALELGEGLVDLIVEERSFLRSSLFACPRCDVDLPELEPRAFSFNSPHGACPRCLGLGEAYTVDVDTLIPDTSLSVGEGAIRLTTSTGVITYTGLTVDDLDDVIDVDKPWKRLTKKARERLLYGDEEFDGLVPILEEVFRETEPARLEQYVDLGPCPDCEGTRLRPAARSVYFRDRDIGDLTALSVDDSLEFFSGLELNEDESQVGTPIVREILHRLEFMQRVGLGYLSVDRSATTLSGGEAQRIRLASQLGSGLRGVLYVLDEPSIGLHARDNLALLSTLRQLRDLGNTVLVVEHDRETIEAADYVVDIGPGAGVHGGELVQEGTVKSIRENRESLTGRYLAGAEKIKIPEARRQPTGFIEVCGARQHNLKNINVKFPLGVMTAVTGVSGSGKSTLVETILHRAALEYLNGYSERIGEHDSVEGLEQIDKIIRIDQSPIGRTPRSNPGTYTKVFDDIRDMFAATAESKVRGYKKGRFSFNVKGGRCENCMGAGVITIRMQFLSDVEVTCEECNGRRYNSETLEVTYRGRNIYEVLEMPMEEAHEFFSEVPRIERTLKVLCDVGLTYVKLGQPSTTLSGGEAQRVKLASELRRPASGSTLYLLDEPTTGLHFDDIQRLLKSLNALVERGNSVIVIEHNLDVVKVADHVIDLGPDGGAGGGKLVAEGTPETVARKKTPTAKALALELAEKTAPVPTKGRRRSTPRQDPKECFRIVGARENNLKNLHVEVPRNRLTVITGPSGSGKSTLAFDILFAEGQRRYIESLSTYARRFLGRMQRADVDRVEGIAPAIAIDQKNRSTSPRSTVATATEIYDYLRILYARVGVPHCPQCDRVLESTTASAAARQIEDELAEERLYVLAPLHTPEHPHNALPRSSSLPTLVPELLKEGFVRVLVDGKEERLEECEDQQFADDLPIHLVVDRVVVGKVARSRMAESLDEAYRRSNGRLEVRNREGSRSLQFTRLPACPDGHHALDSELTPRLFSFNHHSGACERCHGLGSSRELNYDSFFVDPSLGLFKGAMDHRVGNWVARPKGRVRKVLDAAFADHGFDVNRPVAKWTKKALKLLLEGSGDRRYRVRFRYGPPGHRRWASSGTWEGLNALLRKWYEKAGSPRWRQELEQRMAQLPCTLCHGGRLREDLLCVRFAERGIQDICKMSIHQAHDFFAKVPLSARDEKIAHEVLREIDHRLTFLLDVGLDYLSLDRATETLSGGEAQRIRLATQIGNRLVGVLYVLDEPTIGLHQRDNERLLESLLQLRDIGNSVVIVEHDEQTMRLADHIIDLGPMAGHGGGEIVAKGTAGQLTRNRKSVTGQYLSGKLAVEVPEQRRAGDGDEIVIRGAEANNLKNIDVKIPTGKFTTVTGVSGSGKSSLVMDILSRHVKCEFHGSRDVPGKFRKIEGLDSLDGVGVIDQSPLGRTPSSNPATYTGVWAPIRELYAKLPLSKTRGFKPGRFSFNVAAGRCEHCEGKGALLVEMHFLSDVWITCEVCKGARFNQETLNVRFKGKTIADVLQMEIGDALPFFENHPRIAGMLRVLVDVGLGYLALGQAANTLSGGEAQRVKLAAELGKPRRGRKLYLLDEPTTGLHFSDVHKLIDVLHRLVDEECTVVVIEHNLDVIKSADHVIDLGPEGGDGGGTVVAEGSPEHIAETPASHTGRFLKEVLRAKEPA